jgi:hypothetical protein
VEEKGGGGGSSVKRGGGWGRGLVAGTGPEPTEAGSARSVHCTTDVGKGGERKERPRGTWAGPNEQCPFLFIRIISKKT